MGSTIGKIIQAALIVAILLLLLWISFYVLILGLAIAVGIAIYVGGKKFLAEKGIVNEDTPSRPSSPDVIDADYKDVTDKNEKS